MDLKKLTQCSLFTAILAMSGWIAIPLPFGGVPITLQVFIIFCIGGILGKKLGLIVIGLFIGLGAMGIPVFSGMRSGIGILLGPTGGYIWGWIGTIFMIGTIAEKKNTTGFLSEKTLLFIALFLGMLVYYICGCIQLMLVSNISFFKAVMTGAVPFLLLDFVKLFLAIPVILHTRPIVEKNFA